MSRHHGRYTDGKTSGITDVYLRLYKQGIGIFANEQLSGLIDRWSYEDMRVNHDWTDGVGASFEHKTKYGATLGIHDKTLFLKIRNALHNHDQATYLISTRITTLLALAIVAVSIVVFGFPLLSRSSEKLAYIVPDFAEKKVGNMAIGALEEEFSPCHDEIAKKYLGVIINRLLATYDDKSINPEIHIYQTPMVNAFALPGQNMAVLTGFLQDAKSEEEIAGVLAHELGHIANRDPLKYIIQAQGLSIVSTLSASSGSYGGIAQMATTLSGLNYSREKEQAADLFAQNLLVKSGYTANGLISFLERIETKYPEYLKPFEDELSFLSTHPKTQERIGNLGKDEKRGAVYKPSLTPEQMKRLQNACPARSLRKKDIKRP